MIGEDLFGCERDGRNVRYYIFHSRCSITSHGKKDARSEQFGTTDEGHSGGRTLASGKDVAGT